MKIRLEELETKLLAVVAKKRDQVLRSLQGSARIGRALILEEIARTTPHPPQDTGRYQASWKVEDTDTGAIIATALEYAVVIEHGRRPGAKWPPRDVIARWVQRKFGLDPTTANAVAFVIQRKIGKQGIEGRRVLARSWPRIREVTVRRLREAWESSAL